MAITPIREYPLADLCFRKYEETEQNLTNALQAADPNELESAVEAVINKIKSKSNEYSWGNIKDWAIKNHCAKALGKIVVCDEVSSDALNHIFSYCVNHCEKSDYREVLLSMINSSNFSKLLGDNLSGAFQCLLQRGDLEVVKAILNTNRNKKEYLKTYFFDNTIIPTHISNEPILLDTLDKVFKWAMEFEHKNLIPFLLPEKKSDNVQKCQNHFKEKLQVRYEKTILELIICNNLKEGMKEALLDAALSNECMGIVEILSG